MSGVLIVETHELRGTARQDLVLSPLPEPEARVLAGLLLNRPGPVTGPGPWRCPVAGGARRVALRAAGEPAALVAP